MASNDSERSKIYATCIRLLSRREYGQGSLRRKLKSKGFEKQLYEEVLAQLVESDLQSDARCAAAIIRTGVHRGWSRRRCRARMLQEGLTEATMSEAPWPDEEDERATARSLYWKWLGDGPFDRKKQQRVLQRLARRGFSIGFLFDEERP